jgi:DNA-binding CsgD family transcriptional regulator
MEAWRRHFDTVERGFAMLDLRGRVVELNAAADRLLAPFLGLRGQLAFPETLAGRQAAELVARATHPKLRLPLPPPVLLPMAKGVLAIEVVPAPSALRHFHVDAAAILVVRPAEAPVLDRSVSLSRALGITAAEARLAAGIGKGQSLREVADAEGITYETARTRLKAVFAKTGCSRQAELAVLVTRLATVRSRDVGEGGSTQQ